MLSNVSRTRTNQIAGNKFDNVPLHRHPVSAELFADTAPGFPEYEVIAPGACVLRGFALPHEPELFKGLDIIVAQAPFRHLVTPGGFTMSVAMTNCGVLGWISDRAGYRYAARDPLSNRAWPAMPPAFLALALSAAARAGYTNFSPEACLINRYVPGARLALHRDHDEHDLTQPIVSVSLGVPAVFLFGGLTRQERQARIGLMHGDVAVWGSTSRLCFHGIMPLKTAHHARTGDCRINLTFRNVGRATLI
ncbi:MAG: DNA oxidative demethylase AlkB [Burkholderiaceae bacterium]